MTSMCDLGFSFKPGFRFSICLLILSQMLACTTSHHGQTATDNWIRTQLKKSTVLKSGFTGLLVKDAVTGKILCSYQADRHFVPASNTKLVTLLAAVKTFGDSIPLARFRATDSTLTLWGMANPAFMHPFFSSEPAFQSLTRLSKDKKILLSRQHTAIERFGPGWMWDDFNGYYQTELSSFPLYGNILTIKKDSTGLTVLPNHATRRAILQNDPRVSREEYNNLFTLPHHLDTLQEYYQEIPVFKADSVNIALLSSLLNKRIHLCTDSLPADAATLYCLQADTVYRRMMQISDNMIADHLLLGCGMLHTDTLQLEKAVTSLAARLFNGWKTKPVWVDGSGLSRYNLFTPGHIVSVLDSLYAALPQPRLLSLMAQGGGNGTLKPMFTKSQTPYVFAKSGSMSGVYNLSGYLKAKSGRWLIFSCMSNHFNGPVYTARQDTELLIEAIRQRF